MNYNKVLFAGNITRDPELSYTPSQTAIVKFGLAVNKKYKDKEKVCFVDCTAFGATAVNINKYFKKGRPIFIEGELAFEQWTAQDGSKRSKHIITVNSFQFVDSQKTETPEPESEI